MPGPKWSLNLTNQYVAQEVQYGALTCLTGLRLLAITGARGLVNLFQAVQPLTNLQILSVAGAKQQWVPGFGYVEEEWRGALHDLLQNHALLRCVLCIASSGAIIAFMGIAE